MDTFNEAVFAKKMGLNTGGSGAGAPGFLSVAGDEGFDKQSPTNLMSSALEMRRLELSLGLNPIENKRKVEQERAVIKTMGQVENALNGKFDAALIISASKEQIDPILQELNDATVDTLLKVIEDKFLNSGVIAYAADQTEWTEATLKAAGITIPDSITATDRNKLIASAATNFFIANIRARAAQITQSAKEQGRTYLLPDEIGRIVAFFENTDPKVNTTSSALVTFEKGRDEDFFKKIAATRRAGDKT